MDTDFDMVGVQVIDRKCIIYFGRRGVVDAVGTHLCHWQFFEFARIEQAVDCSPVFAPSRKIIRQKLAHVIIVLRRFPVRPCARLKEQQRQRGMRFRHGHFTGFHQQCITVGVVEQRIPMRAHLVGQHTRLQLRDPACHLFRFAFLPVD